MRERESEREREGERERERERERPLHVGVVDIFCKIVKRSWSVWTLGVKGH